jgi:C1A family cysteine protease
VLNVVKINIASKNAVLCGFSLFANFNNGGATIPYPEPNEPMVGSHSVLLVGYDDSLQALLFQNSWGPTWGNGGFGFLPYRYVIERLARDFWCITKAEWVATKGFV